MRRPPIILANPSREKRQEHPTILPGAVAIMQRESSGTALPLRATTSPITPVYTSSEALPLSPHHASSSSSTGQLAGLKPRDQEGKGRPQRRSDGLSSSPSSYTPLQPGSRGAGRETSRADHTPFQGQPSEMAHPVKMVDKSWHWEDKGMDSMLEQSDFLVVGALGKQGVGKSTVMSLLTGTRTGSGKPFMFRPQSREQSEGGAFQSTGVDMIVTAERTILLDAQPVLSESMLEQFQSSPELVPAGLAAEMYLEILSLQLAVFLFTVCHVIVVVMDTMESAEVMFRFLWTAERMCLKVPLDLQLGEKQQRDFFPQIVFVLNQASVDDFQPATLRETHTLIANNFHKSKLTVAGGVSLLKSGLVPTGRELPRPSSSKPDSVEPGSVNLHLLPHNSSAGETYSVHVVCPPAPPTPGEGELAVLAPVLSLLPSFQGHPSYQLLSETLRNQVLAMPRPLLRRTGPQTQLTEREWFEYARRVWLTLKKSDLIGEYDRLLQATPPDRKSVV